MRRGVVAGYVLVVLVVALCFGVVLVDVNRFFGKHVKSCGWFNDSLGGLDENGTRVCYIDRNLSQLVIDPGIVFGDTERSELAWVYISVVSVLAIVLSLGCYLYRIWERRVGRGTVTEGVRNEHSEDHRRICWIVYFCTALAILYETVVFVKVVRCRRSSAEGVHTVLSAASHIAQGMYLIYEVNHRSVNKVKSGVIFKSILVSQAIMNFTLWGDALFDAACRVEPDNSIFFGDDFWIICKPVFKAALVALRILSALLFLMLAMHSDNHSAEVTTSQKTREPSHDTEVMTSEKVPDTTGGDKEDQASAAVQASQKKIRRYQKDIDGLDRTVGYVGTAIRILLQSRSKSIDAGDLGDKVHNNSDGHGDTHAAQKLQSAVTRMMHRNISTRLAAVTSKSPDVNYGVAIEVSRLAENRFQFIAEAISSNQMGTKALMQSLSFLGLIVILVPPVVLGWALKLLDEDHESKYAPELLIHIIIIGCCLCILIPQCPVHHHWHITTRVPFTRRTRDLVYNPELFAVTIFGIAAILYHFFLLVFFLKGHELFVAAWPQVDSLAAIVSAVLRVIIIWIFRMHNGATFRKRNNSATEIILGVLFACSVSVLIMDIQREEFDQNEHKLIHHLHMLWVEPLLGVLAPLSIDFSLHAALLLYSVFQEYVTFSGELGTLPDNDEVVEFDVPDLSESKSLGYDSLLVMETSV